MPWVVAASAAVGAVGSLASGALSAGAAKDAASTQAAAANRAADMTQARFEQTRTDLAPYRDLGANTIPDLLKRFPQLSSGFNPDQATLEATPGYQFTRNQGLQAVQNSAAAKGLGISGAALKGAALFATGLADNTYRTQFDIDQANKTNAFNKLMGLVGTGQNSATQTGTLGQAATQNAGNFLTSGAAAQAAGTVGSANALSSGINGSLNSVQNGALLNKLFNGGSGGGGGGTGPYAGPPDGFLDPNFAL